MKAEGTLSLQYQQATVNVALHALATRNSYRTGADRCGYVIPMDISRSLAAWRLDALYAGQGVEARTHPENCYRLEMDLRSMRL